MIVPTKTIETMEFWWPSEKKEVNLQYPNGLPLTMEVFDKLYANASTAHDVDIVSAISGLLPQSKLWDYVAYTFRLRRDALVTLFQRTGFNDHALEISALRFDTQSDLITAVKTFGLAWEAAASARATLPWNSVEREDTSRAYSCARESAEDAALSYLWLSHDATRSIAERASETCAEALDPKTMSSCYRKKVAKREQMRWLLYNLSTKECQ